MRKHALAAFAILSGLSSAARADLVVAGMPLFERYNTLSHRELTDICSSAFDVGYSSVFGGAHQWQGDNPRAGLLHAQIEAIVSIHPQTKASVSEIFIAARTKLEEIGQARGVHATSKMRSDKVTDPASSARSRAQQAFLFSDSKLDEESLFVINQSIADTHKALEADQALYLKPRGAQRARTDAVNSADYYRTCVKFWAEGAPAPFDASSIGPAGSPAPIDNDQPRSAAIEHAGDDAIDASQARPGRDDKARIEARFSVENEPGQSQDDHTAGSSKPWWAAEEPAAQETSAATGAASDDLESMQQKWWEPRAQSAESEPQSQDEKMWWQ